MNKLAIINSPIYPMITSLVKLFRLKTRGLGVKLLEVGFCSAQQESTVSE